MARAPAKDWSSRRYRESPRFRLAMQLLGAKIKKLRERQGLTLEEAAVRAEMDLTHWQKLEAGKLNPTMVTLLRVADGLGATMERLFREARPRSKK
jgi:transcriptional regulator with XRE-family HTH domain